MRIALVSPYDLGSPGGVQVHVRELSGKLRAGGHDVLVLSPGVGRRSNVGSVAVARPTPVRYNGSVAPIALQPWQRGRLRGELARFRPDVVHVHEPLVPSTSMYASLVSAAPVIGTFHAFGERSRLYDVAAPLLRGVSRHLAVRIAVSEAAAGFAASRIGGTFEIVPNGVDVARFRDAEPMSNAPPRPVVLFVGRLEPRKGVGVMLEAFRLSKGGWNLLVVGDGSGRSEIDALPAALAARVRALGAVENETLPSCHASADVLVAPSLGGESFGMVITEGMAAGLGIVASDIPGYREVVGEAGILVPPGDAPALAEALDRACSDPDLLTRLGSAARQRASEFSWDVVAARLEQIYAEVSRVA